MNYDLIIPIYNIENELDQCLNSILHQTYRNFWVTMVDDGSTDRSSLIAKAYARRDARFAYYRKKHAGLSDARNFGISKISCEYTLFIDGDDYIEPDTLETIESELARTPVDVLEFNGWFEEDGEKTRLINYHYKDAGMVKNARDFVFDNLKAGYLVAPVYLKVVRSSLILENNHLFAKGMIHEDELWTPKLYFMADTIKYIDTCLYHYVQREGSITHQSNKARNARHAKAIFRHLEGYYKSLPVTRRQQRILTSYLSRQMIGACQMSEKEGMSMRDKKFIIRNAKDIRSISKMLLFIATPGHYDKLSGMIKKCLPNLFKEGKPYCK